MKSQPTGLNLFSNSESFLTDLSPADESAIKGGKHGKNSKSNSKSKSKSKSRAKNYYCH
jgi:hypothetical protein